MSNFTLKTGVVMDKRYLEHDPGSNHVESPERLRAIYALFEEPDFKDKFVKVEPRRADQEELSWNHSEEYIKRVAATAGKASSYLDPDTRTSEKSYDVALLAVGGVFALMDVLLDKKISNGFALVRPPGHHAEVDRAMGFCLFNNVALGAHYLIKRYGLKRVLIVDWDIHHGNGTQHSFYDRSDVLYFSTHQFPYYPGTGNFNEIGSGEGAGYTVNIPLAGGQGESEYIAIFQNILRPIALEYKPEMVLVSAGFDIYHRDPLGTMQITEKGFARLTHILMDLADLCCQGRLLLVLEGGYNVMGQKESIRAVLNVLTGENILVRDFAHREENQIAGIIKRVRETHKKYWSCFR